MSRTYETVGQAIYNFVDAIDITAAKPVDWFDDTLVWGDKLNRPPKSNELNVYPAFVIVPAEDGQETGDTDVDFDSVTYSVFIITKFAEANMAEGLLRQVVDIVRTSFRALRADPSPLLEAAYDIRFRGEWGGVPDQGERYYKLNVTVFVHETLLETP